MSGDKAPIKVNTDTMILIGDIVSAVGIKGEIKSKCYSEGPERFGRLEYLFLDSEKFPVEGVRSQGNMAIIKLKTVDTRNQGEALIGKRVYIEEDQLEPLPEDTYYVRDLVGLKVKDFGDGIEVGLISDVIQNGPQDIYVISLPEKKEAMVPAVKEFIKEVNVKEGFISIKFIEGMLP